MSNNRNYSSGKCMYLHTKFNKLILLLFFLITFFCSTRAQTYVDSVNNDWETRWRITSDVEWSDNVFYLSSSQKSRMNLNDPGDVVSGRFRDMQSINDVIISIKPEFRVKNKKGLFNRSLSISGIIDYQHYINNPKKDHFKLGLSIQQNISKSGKLILQTDYTPSYFVKNFLLDATDSTGKVSSSERVYNKGVFSDLEFILSYRHQFRKWIVDLEGDLFIGYRSRSYNSQFPGRNQDAFSTGLALEIEPAKWWILYLGYLFESIQSPVSNEVMILDEPDYQIDFNNDRDFADNNRRTVQSVNRSRYSQTLDFGLTLRPFKLIAVHAGIELCFKDFTSQEPIDPNYKNRNDTKTSLQLGFDYQIFKNLFLMVEYESIVQLTNRLEDPESVGEITDYNAHIMKAGIQWLIF